MLTEKAAVRRLGDRFGFGWSSADLVAAQQRGFAATVRDYLRPSGRDAGAEQTPEPDLPVLARPVKQGGQPPDQAELKAWRQAMRAQVSELTWWWLDRMTLADHQATERLTWFWHGHFATSSQKVKSAPMMLGQNCTMRQHALGGFTPLAQAMIVDPAMLIWLDGNDNTAKAPNENLSREYLELFTLGQGKYTETDIREAARALTGWKVNRITNEAVFRNRLHDPGSKTIFDRAADYDAASFVTAVLGQTDSARFIASRLWFRLVAATPPSEQTVNRLSRAYGSQHNLSALLSAIAAESAFRDVASTLVKQPVEWVVGLMRALPVRPSALTRRQQSRLTAALRGMGQVPLLPPSVGGWPAGGAWLSTSGALSRIEAARLLAQAATLPAEAKMTSVKNRPEYLRRLLGVDRFSPRTVDAIAAVADRWPLAITVAACSPEYTVSG